MLWTRASSHSSSNEELTTVNEELDTRNQQLGILHDDLNNLLSAATTPILKVDRALFLRRITPAAGNLGISPTDLNHPIRDLQQHLGRLPDVEPLIREVIDKLTVQTYDFQDKEGCWWSLSVRPYRTTDDRIDGAVLTFTGTDGIQRALQASETARRYADAIIETVREPLVILTPDLRVERANASFYAAFGIVQTQTEGQLIDELKSIPWDIERVRAQLEEVLRNSSSFRELEVEYTAPGMGKRAMLLNARHVSQESRNTGAILLAFEDITERRNHEEGISHQLKETGLELDRTKEELRSLASRLMNAHEETDRRIARELHDDFSQRLAFLEITIEKYRIASNGKDSPEVLETLDVLQRRISELSADVRTLSHRMHPAVLDDLGLVPALTSLAEEFELLRSAPVHFATGDIPESLPRPNASAVYRIAQEALRGLKTSCRSAHSDDWERRNLGLLILDRNHLFGLGLRSLRH